MLRDRGRAQAPVGEVLLSKWVSEIEAAICDVFERTQEFALLPAEIL